jgi:hypothetical protein
MNLREINWFVAEKVMNWHVWENEDGELMVTKGYGCYSHCPSFSTNIADAWQVVEKLYKDKGLRMFVGLDFPPLYMARLKDDKGDWIGHGTEAETAPLAICLAALKAVGVNIE